MKEYFQMPIKKRLAIIEGIKKNLGQRKDLVFAYVFGSFLDSPSFKDIDVGVYIDNVKNSDVFEKELEIAKILGRKTGLSFDMFDVKILNFCSYLFLNNIFKNGKMLFSKNPALLSDIIEKSSLSAIANEYISYQSLKDLAPT